MKKDAMQILSETAKASNESISPFPASAKRYITGSREDIRVPVRNITLSPTPSASGSEHNHPVAVYDTSGVYTDSEVTVDIREGLQKIRNRWIEERNDTEQLDTFSSNRVVNPEKQKLTKMSHKCIMQKLALSRLKWSLSLFVKI